MPPLGPPPRLFGLKITSNRIESALIMFVTLCLSGIFYGNNLIPAAQNCFDHWSDMVVISLDN